MVVIWVDWCSVLRCALCTTQLGWGRYEHRSGRHRSVGPAKTYAAVTSPALLPVALAQLVGNLLAMSLLGTGTCALVSVLVLPSLALDEMRADTAAAIRGIGHAASRCG